jgi:hypothetical protein
VSHRPGEYHKVAAGVRTRVGAAGPDQGYALLLAEGVSDRVVLGHSEHIEDALAVAIQIALRRASKFGRAPVRADLETALALLSYLSPISDEAVLLRHAKVMGASHDLWRCRAIAESVDDDALALGPAAAAAAAIDWTGSSAS